MQTDNMSKYFVGGRRRGVWLIVLGAVLTAAALLMLYMTPGVAQYILPSPEETVAQSGIDEDGGETPQAESTGLARALELWNANKSELGESAKAGIMASAYDFGVYSSDGLSEIATMCLTSLGWFDVHPLFLLDGRIYNETDHKTNAKVIVLDENLAFKLFPTTTAIEGRVDVNGEWYAVIGVVRHKWSAGATDTYQAYIPLETGAKAGMQTDYTQMDSLINSQGAARALQSISETVLGEGGSFCDTTKEMMRASMIVRIMAILFGLYILGTCLRGWNVRTGALIRGWQAEVMKRYFKDMLPKVIGLSLMQLLGYAVLIGGAFALLALIIQPMYVFTEWIPEVIVEWSKIYARIENLMITSAQTARYQTREFAAIRFYGAMIRWGVLCVLMGTIINLAGRLLTRKAAN